MAPQQPGTHAPNGQADPRISVIVSTRDRAELLGPAIESLAVSCERAPFPVEVLVIDNGSSDATPALIRDMTAQREGWQQLTVAERGKARALNHGLAVARADLLAFTDDDVIVDPDWITELSAFFSAHPQYDAAMGRVIADPSVTDRDVLALVEHYRTLPLYENGSEVVDDVHLYGCNMGIRREALERVGPFNDRLGPGASGLHEDGEMASRILGAGMRIGYIPGCVIAHSVERDRLSDDFFLEMHRRDGRSRFVMDAPRGCGRALVRFVGTTVIQGLWSLFGRRRESMRARARAVSHREYLRAYFASRRNGAAPANGAAGGRSPRATATE